MELPILVRGHYKYTVLRYDIETLFIIIERYVKLYIFDCVEIVHDRAMAICVMALNRDVSGRLHCIEIISNSFSICCLLNRPAFRVRVLSGVINNVPFFFCENSKYYALAYKFTHMRSAYKSFGTVLAALVKLPRMDSKGYFSQRWSQAMSGQHIKP